MFVYNTWVWFFFSLRAIIIREEGEKKEKLCCKSEIGIIYMGKRRKRKKNVGFRCPSFPNFLLGIVSQMDIVFSSFSKEEKGSSKKRAVL